MDSSDNYNEIEIKINSIKLKGFLRLANNSKGIILFSHGSGSSRYSSRNNYVANLLLERGFSSLLFDLLTFKEDSVYENRFDIELLSKRLLKVTNWIRNYPSTKNLSIGFFGSSTGAASALKAASKLNKKVKAIVSRGGRPDLSIEVLKDIKIPTLLIVGGNDVAVIELNKKAQKEFKGICELRIIEGATHLFTEPGKLKLVAKHTGDWFDKFLK